MRLEIKTYDCSREVSGVEKEAACARIGSIPAASSNPASCSSASTTCVHDHPLWIHPLNLPSTKMHPSFVYSFRRYPVLPPGYPTSAVLLHHQTALRSFLTFSPGNQHAVAFYPSRPSNNMLLHPSPSFLIFPSLLSRVFFVRAKGIFLFLGLKFRREEILTREKGCCSCTGRSIFFCLIRLRLY